MKTDSEYQQRLDIANEVQRELAKAMEKHRPMHSAHEGYAVILEELDELWDNIKINPKKLSESVQKELRQEIRKEAIQVAAMAMRFVVDVCGEEG